MKVCIHRGAVEIGGSCVELEADGKSLILDLGLPLDHEEGVPVLLPPVRGLSTGGEELLGVLVSHVHRDHWGLLPQVHPNVSIYMGAAAERILEAASFFSPFGHLLRARGHLEDCRTFELGPFRITPYLNDHSAFDAYSLLVEAGGRRLFYTGDIRGHGRKAALFERLLRDPPLDVDVLLMEGTNIRPTCEKSSALESEEEVEQACIQTFKQAPALVLVAFSVQNIDRLTTIYRATLQADRDLAIDLYADTVARATDNPRIPHAGFHPERDQRLKIFVPHRQRVLVKEAGAFHRTQAVVRHRIYPEDLLARRRRLVLLFRSSMVRELERADCLDRAALVWSLWNGYLRPPRGDRARQFIRRHRIPLVEHHTSGHAPVKDLQRLVAALRPKTVVPIHTDAAQMYRRLFPEVTVHPDGLWRDI